MILQFYSMYLWEESDSTFSTSSHYVVADSNKISLLPSKGWHWFFVIVCVKPNGLWNVLYFMYTLPMLVALHWIYLSMSMSFGNASRQFYMFQMCIETALFF